MEQKFYSTVEAADKAGITGAPSGVGKTFRRLAAKLGLVPTKEKGALCWTEADIAEVKANYKPRAKRTATVETPAISANNNETDGSENIIDAPNDEVVTTAQVVEPTNAPVVEETATVETVDVPPAEETDDREVVSENTPAADTLPAPMDKPPADVQPENADETEGILGKKIMPATADQSTASKEIAEINIHGNNIIGGDIVQQLSNLPAELLNLPRWIEVGTADNPKRPKTKDWQRAKNQRPINALRGKVGFVCSVHPDDRHDETREDYLLIDCDHVFDKKAGEFVNHQAQTWINFLLTSLAAGDTVFCERSISGTGFHILCKPTRGKFNLAAGDDGTLYFGKHDTAEEKKACPKIELFVGTQGRQVVLTGALYQCAPAAAIPSGGTVDDIVETLINQIKIQNKPAAEPVKPATVKTKKTFSGRGMAQETIDAVNQISAERVEAAGLIIKAPTGHYICPRCKSGTHANASGALATDNNRGFTHWHCHSGSCTFDGNNIQLFAEIWNLDPVEDFVEVVTRAAELFDIPVEYTAPTNNGTQSKLRDCPIDLVIPENFIFNQHGITYALPSKKDDTPPRKIVVSRTPIVPTRIFRDVTSGAIRYEVGIKFRGQWRRTETDGRTLTDPRTVFNLAGTGALITEPKLICRYFADIINGNDNLPEVKSFNKPGWYKINGTEQFIYPTGDSGVDGYVVRRSNIDYDDLFSVEGNPEEWKNTFRHVLSRSVIHRTVIGASLAAPLLKILGEPNFCLHVEGTSNYAKSPLVKFALSVYGNPTEGQLFRTFDATAKNLITMAAGFNDFPQAIDEAESMSKRAYEEFSKTVYDFAAGVINQANLRNGNVRKAEKFRGVRISTGERPLLKITDKKGAFKRLITIHVDKPLFTDKEAVALHRFCERNHGHFGRLWTEYIAANRDRIVADFDILLDNAQEGALAKQIDEAAVRAVTACTVAFWHFRILLDLEKVFDFQTADADIYQILRRLPTKDETSDLTRGISLLASWVDEHPKNFIQAGDKSSTEISAVSFTETSGVIFTDGRVGFFQNAFRRIVEKELELPSYQKFLNDLDAADKLICPKRGNEKAIQKKISGRNRKIYLFKADVLVSPADSEDAESADEPA